MPGTVRTPRQEKMWKRAKKHVEDSRGYGEGSFTDQDWGLVQTIYQRIKAKNESIKVNLSSLDEAKKRKRKRCDCGVGCDRCYGGWYFAPFYGPGDGTSGAANGPYPSADVPSGAKPGAGGINSPSVPAGPNSGMGPVTMSRTIDSRDFWTEAQDLKRFFGIK